MSERAGQISAETAAKLIMVTTRHLQRLVKDGWIKKTADGKYTVLSTVQGFIAYLKDESRRNSQISTKSGVNDARTREIDLRIAIKERELIDAGDVMTAVDEMAAALRNALTGFPARFTRDLDLRRKLQKGLNGLLAELAGTFERRASDLAAGVNADSTVEDDDAGAVGEAKPEVSGKRRRSRAARPKSDAVRHTN